LGVRDRKEVHIASRVFALGRGQHAFGLRT
jgi:hypothetical protein